MYGLLAIAAALAVVVRASADDGAAKVAKPDVYTGRTAQGTRLEIGLVGRRFSYLSADGIWGRCAGGRHERQGVRWNPSAGQGNVTVSSRGSEFAVHERPDPRFPHPPGARVNVYLRGNLNWDVHRIDGEITYVETGARGKCASGPIPFGVSR